MTTTIFIKLLWTLDASVNIQGRNILFAGICATHPQDEPLPKDVEVMHYTPNCTSMLQPLHFKVIKCSKQIYRKKLVLKAVCLIDSVKDVGSVYVFKVIYSTEVATCQASDSCEQLLSLWMQTCTSHKT